MEFLQRTPFFRLLLPFIIGIIGYQYVEFLHRTLYGLLGLSLLLVISSFLIQIPARQYQFRWLFGCGILGFMFSLGSFLSGEHEKANLFDHVNQKGIYRVEITSPPIEKARSYRCIVDVIQYFDALWKPAHGQAILYFQKERQASKLRYGDILILETDFASPERLLNPDGFDYAAYLKRQGISATGYVSSARWQLSGKNTSFSIRRAADNCRNYLLDIYRNQHIRGDELAVLSALTLGYTDDLRPDIRAAYSATGVVHILSVSGMHVGIIYVVMVFLLGFMNKSRLLRVVKALFILIFLWVYAFITGMSPPVIRATLMFTFLAVATCLDRKSHIYNTIFMSMFTMLLVNPMYLFDVGFQLSYAAVLSIIFFKPVLDKLYTPTTKITRFTWTLLSVSLAAQLGTAPFTLYYFQQFPNYFIITNFIAIPLSTLIIYLAICLPVLSIIPFLSQWVALLLNKSVWLLNLMILYIQNLPYAVSHISLDIRQSLLVFLAIFCLSGYYFSRKYAPLVVGLVSLLVACVFSLQVNFHTLTTRRVIVYAGQKNTHVSFINRNQNYVFSTDSQEIKRIAGSYWKNQKLAKPHFLCHNNWFNEGFACYEGFKILILTENILKGKSTGKPLELDYLIIGNRLKPKMEQLLKCIRPQNVIVDRSISKWYTGNIRQWCKNSKIGFYSVAAQGAYILNIKD